MANPKTCTATGFTINGKFFEASDLEFSISEEEEEYVMRAAAIDEDSKIPEPVGPESLNGFSMECEVKLLPGPLLVQFTEFLLQIPATKRSN